MICSHVISCVVSIHTKRGYDCSTPICVQAERFRLNIQITASNYDDLVSLGGRGKNGRLKCHEARCPEYDNMVTMNDGRSFQTGCGFDPIDTGCCYKNHDTTNTNGFFCFKCREENLEKTSNGIICHGNGLEKFEYKTVLDLPSNFKHSGEIPRFCGPWHNPGGFGDEYFISDDPFAFPEQSNRNFLSNVTSDTFLCKIHVWEQGNYTGNFKPNQKAPVMIRNSVPDGRHFRNNALNYQRDKNNQYLWTKSTTIYGKVLI